MTDDFFLREQDFVNYLQLHDYRNAILLALAMQQPGRLHTLFKNLQSTNDIVAAPSITGHPAVDEVIRTLPGVDLARLLRYVRDWNANAKTSGVAQRVLHAVVKLRVAEDVMAAFADEGILETVEDGAILETRKESKGSGSLKEMMDALIPYTERHLARMDRLIQDSYVVDYLLGEMDDGMFDLDEDEVGDAMMDVDKTVGVAA